MIDDKKFIADIEKRYCEPCKKTESDWGGNKCRICWVDDMMDEIENAPKVGEWIPCSERLPKQGEQVIGTFVSNKGSRWVMQEQFFPSLLDVPFPMVAWMPLPEPYREEEQ